MTARRDLTVSFTLVFVFCISMIFLATQINWAGQILDEGRDYAFCWPIALVRRLDPLAGLCSCSASGAPRFHRVASAPTVFRFCSTTCFTVAADTCRWTAR